MPSAPVEVRNLTQRYGPLAALDDCSFALAPGEICGLLGPNGAGKSTLLRLLMGYLRPTSGQARIAGLDCYADSVAVHERTAYLPGDARLFPHFAGRDVLRFFASLRGPGFAERAALLARRLDLDLARRVGAMSTGMRQKLALVTVLAVDAPLVILDEPTSNLDPTVRGEVVALVREAQQAGRTVFFSSHILDEVEKTCDRVLLLRAGKLVYEQPMHALRRQHRIVAGWQGPPPALPSELAGDLELTMRGDELVIISACALSPLLTWLATLPTTELRIEPVGLAAVYERFHPADLRSAALREEVA
ncbi:MAG: ABC transporter ATP-binding protein [Pirellula sp.]|nr:ABC transporter ATP-binding protein [Pirellula sp.]